MAQDKHLRQWEQRNNMSVPHTKEAFQAAGSLGAGEWQDWGIFSAGCGSEVYTSEKTLQIQANETHHSELPKPGVPGKQT